MNFSLGNTTFMYLNRVARTDHGFIVNARYDPELGLLVDEPD